MSGQIAREFLRFVPSLRGLPQDAACLSLLCCKNGIFRGMSTSGVTYQDNQYDQPAFEIRTTDPAIPLPRYVPPRTNPERHRQPLPLPEAIRSILGISGEKKRKFDESLEIAVNTSIDPRRGDQMVRGVASLPHGTGRTVRVCVFCASDADRDAALQAGAETIGDESLIGRIQQEGSSAVDFDVCLATPDMMAKLGKIARVLGPRGLMPNPKLGTVTNDVSGGVQGAKAGRVEFRADKGAVIHAGCGKVSFSEDKLEENVRAFIEALVAARPKAIKGMGLANYIESVRLSTTMSKGSQPVTLDSF
jgi:ribosomal protein L1